MRSRGASIIKIRDARAPGHLIIRAGIAQWQSNRFVSGRLGVQVPLPA